MDSFYLLLAGLLIVIIFLTILYSLHIKFQTTFLTIRTINFLIISMIFYNISVSIGIINFYFYIRRPALENYLGNRERMTPNIARLSRPTAVISPSPPSENGIVIRRSKNISRNLFKFLFLYRLINLMVL